MFSFLCVHCLSDWRQTLTNVNLKMVDGIIRAFYSFSPLYNFSFPHFYSFSQSLAGEKHQAKRETRRDHFFASAINRVSARPISLVEKRLLFRNGGTREDSEEEILERGRNSYFCPLSNESNCQLYISFAQLSDVLLCLRRNADFVSDFSALSGGSLNLQSLIFIGSLTLF